MGKFYTEGSSQRLSGFQTSSYSSSDVVVIVDTEKIASHRYMKYCHERRFIELSMQSIITTCYTDFASMILATVYQSGMRFIFELTYTTVQLWSK